MRKRLLAGILAVTMMVSAVICPNDQVLVMAAEAGTEQVNVESTEVNQEETQVPDRTEDTIPEETEKNVDDSQNTESSETTEPAEGTETTETVEETEATETVGETEATEVVEEIEETEETEETEEARYYIQYLVMESDKISLNETQKVVLGIDCEKEIDYASLEYHNQQTGEVLSQDSKGVTDGAILFEIAFQNASQEGSYQLDAVTFVVNGKKCTENIKDAGIDAVFGMEQDVDVSPDAIIEDESSQDGSVLDDADIVQIDEDGNVISQNSIEDALDSVIEEDDGIALFSARRDIVVVLDPGHDNSHTGAQGNGLREETINLKIAAYCKQELEEYSGVKVYLTRPTDGSCPYPGTTSGVCNEDRVKYASSVGADIYVSLHNNSSTNTSAHGAMVFYPNTNYNSGASQTGKGLAQLIENHLVALGLYNRGITIKDAQQDKYPDGTAADYYGVIRNCKLAGIPAIIVEHAFVSNSNDAGNYLNTDAKLQKLGVADATAIAEYYGLSKGVNVTSDSIKITNLNNAAGTATLSVNGVSPDDKVRAVSFAVWSKADQSDIYWYHATKVGVGGYSSNFQISNHKYNQGTYYVEGYAEDIYGISHLLGRASCSFSVTGGSVSVRPVTAGQYTLTLTGVTVPGGTAGVSFAVWGDVNGQNDLRWYNATKNSDGSWSTILPIANHGELGVYHVWAYAVNMGLTSTCAVQTAFEHQETASVQSIAIKNMNSTAGTFDIFVNGVQASCGVSKVQIPVWSESDQSDIYWYTATKQSDGSYAAQVNLKNHGYNYSTYNIHVYVTSSTQVKMVAGVTTTEVYPPAVNLKTELAADELTCNLTASNVKLSGGVQKVYFAVWSDNGGQDDLVWYEAQESGGVWKRNISIADHKTDGTYEVHLYAENSSGKRIFMGNTTFDVSSISVQKIQAKNVDAVNGSFDVVVSGFVSPSGVHTVQVPVWSKSDQSDIHWYTAAKQADGTYIAHVEISNHDYNYGKYTIHTYVTAGNGVYKFTGSTSTSIYPLHATVSAVLSSDEKTCSLSASGVQMPGGVQKVYFAVWSEEGGQDDLVWYAAEKSSDRKWDRDILISSHKTAGTYQVHAYGEDSTGKRTVLGTTTFQVSSLKIQTIQVKNLLPASGTFDVFFSGIQSPSGVSKLQVPVWSKDDQSDIYWYTAARQSDGTYAVQVNLKNHDYNYGKYTVATGMTAGNGIYQFTGAVSVQVNLPSASVRAVLSSDEKTSSITAENVALAGGVQGVYFAVWSEAGGQDDLIWYQAAKTREGTWKTDISISSHKSEGVYQVHLYGVDRNGNRVFMGNTTFNVSYMSVQKIQVKNLNNGTGTFDVFLSGITAPSGVSKVQIPVWSKADQSDIYWYTATRQSDGSYAAQVNIKNHGYNYGKYTIHTYVTAGNGVYKFTGSTSATINVPTTTMQVGIQADGRNCNLVANNVGLQGGVKKVYFAVWSETGGQDDLRWYEASNTSSGVWVNSFLLSNHKTAGVYEADTYAIDSQNNYVPMASIKFTVQGPSASAVNLVNYNESDGTFGVKVSGATSPAGIASVKVAVWSAGNQSDLVWYDATHNSDGSYVIGADVRNHSNNTGTYYADAYVYDNNGIALCAGRVTCSMIQVTNLLHPISGSTSVTVQQMVNYYNTKAVYPSFYQNTEASTIQAFCQIYIEECRAEGIKAEVAFCQAMKETGFLRYGGNVQIEQYNFAGMGSTGPGVRGESYPDVRTGIRAQVQHLKAYANTDSLNNICVDSRFRYVTRGTAPYVEWLGIKQNPYGKGWATANNYGYQIVDMVNKLKQN